MSASSKQNPLVRVLGLRDFRLLFAGTTTSLLGDQLYLIATPWLVLTLTGDPLALGVVLALEGLPRAIFMLVGGAITDRLSPRTVMLASDLIRFGLTTLMALVVFTGAIQIWMLYAFGLGFGLVSGFAVPAGNSIVPMLVGEQDLQAGNAIMMGIGQLISFVGPTAAGILIGGFASSFVGVGLALAADAATFAVSALCLWLIRAGGRPAAGGPAGQERVWASIVAGVRHMWADPALRLLLLILAALNFFFSGPLLVSIPVLANQYLPEGALAFGLLMSAMSGGSLVGILLAGALPRPGGKAMRTFLIALLAGFSLVLGAFGFIRSTWADVALLLLAGIGNGYIMIVMFTWMQANTPKALLGRMMSIVMLASSGLIPVSQAISGAVITWNLTMLLASAGAMLLLVTLWSAFQPGLRLFSTNLTAAPAEA